MKIAKNQSNKLIRILDSVPNDTYFCPVCKEQLERKYGVEKQYYAHPKNKDQQDCELKMGLIFKENPKQFENEEQIILSEEYYNKSFDDIKIQLSDYKSEEGYFLTEEQKSIIFAPEDRIKISALAGSAKSNTLYYYAKERPYKKILYLVYNKAMKDEAIKMYSSLDNVEIKTIHGLAYGYVGNLYRSKLTFNYNAIDVIKDLNLNWNTEQDIAVKVNEMMKEYLLSDVTTFDELNMYKDESNKEYRPRIISLCEKLWELKKDYHSNIKITHDFYLKCFQMSKKELSDKYDIIMLDECQDASKLILDILMNSKVKGIVMVGDKFQALYSWRKAINIQPLFEGKEYFLTTSFRVSQNIANIANLIIQDVSNEKVNMKGFNTKQKIVSKIDKNKPYVCLCRTNSYIFSEVIDTIQHKNKSIYFEGGYKGYKFENIKDAFYFQCGHETKNPLFSKFKNYNQMEKYLEENEDLELLSITRMVEKYGFQIPELVEKVKRNIVNDKSEADVLFTTIHKSKGMTYSIPVLILDDHFDINKFFWNKFIEKDDDNTKVEDYFEEMAIVYVAITRCAGQIELSDNIKRYLLSRLNFF